MIEGYWRQKGGDFRHPINCYDRKRLRSDAFVTDKIFVAGYGMQIGGTKEVALIPIAPTDHRYRAWQRILKLSSKMFNHHCGETRYRSFATPLQKISYKDTHSIYK